MPIRLRSILLLIAFCAASLVSCAGSGDLSPGQLRFFWLGQEKLLSLDSPEAAIAQMALEEALTEVAADSSIVYSDIQFQAKANGYPRFEATFGSPRRFATGKGNIELDSAVLVAESQGMLLLISPADFTGWQVYSVRTTENTQRLLAAIRDALSDAIARDLIHPVATTPALRRASTGSPSWPDPADLQVSSLPVAPETNAPLLTWTRREADRHCDRLAVWGDGSAQYGLCEADMSSGLLPSIAMESLERWAGDLAPFSLQRTEPEQGLYFELAWFGHGSRQPNPDESAMILLWSTRLHNVLQQP
jgi:hypothetical protein